MARHPSDKKVRRAIERHNERVAEAAAERFAELPRGELAHHASSLLAPLGWVETHETAAVSDGLSMRGRVTIGVTSLPAAALILTTGAELTGARLDAFLATVAPEVHLAHVLCLGSISHPAREAATASWPLVLIHDRSSILRLMLEARTLMHEVAMPQALALQEAKKPSVRPRTTSSGRADRRGRAARLFRWRMEPREGNRYALHGDYIPDPSQSFMIERELVPPDGDFVPARRELHQAVCRCLSTIFPELPASRIRTKAWAGVHKVYRAKTYGRQQAKD